MARKLVSNGGALESRAPMLELVSMRSKVSILSDHDEYPLTYREISDTLANHV